MLQVTLEKPSIHFATENAMIGGGGEVCTVCVERCKRKIRRETNCSLCGNILRKIHHHDWFLIDSFLTSGGRESSTHCENGS